MPGVLEAGRPGRDGVDELHRAPTRRRPVLDLLDCLVAAVDAGQVGERVVLDVHVEAGDVVGRHDLLVGGRDLVDIGAAVGDLAAFVVGAVPAERRHDVTAARPDLRDVGAVGRPRDRLAGLVVPVEVARTTARRLDERHRQVPGARSLRERGRADAVLICLEVGGEDVRGQLLALGSGVGRAGQGTGRCGGEERRAGGDDAEQSRTEHDVNSLCGAQGSTVRNVYNAVRR